MTEKLNTFLTEKNVVVASPARRAFREFGKNERAKLSIITSETMSAAERAEAMDALYDLQDSFLSEVYPGLDVQEMPADLFRDLLTATIETANGSAQGN